MLGANRKARPDENRKRAFRHFSASVYKDMEEYVSRACPYCGGPQIDKRDGEYVCAYCLQPLDISNGILSDGYNRLASYNFVGAAAFFRSMTGVVGAEAYYGLFLAQNKITENRRKGEIAPIVFSYRPASFREDEAYTELLGLCADERGLIKRLEKIEAVRAATLHPETEYDAVAFCDDGAAEDCRAFVKAMTLRGYRIAVYTDFDAPEIATLRVAKAAYAFASCAQTADRLLRSGAARRFLLLENERTATTGVGKKPMKLVQKEGVSALLAQAAQGLLDIVPYVDAATEARRMKFAVRASGQSPTVSFVAAQPVVAERKLRASDYRAETGNEESELAHIARNLKAENYAEALSRCNKLESVGCKSPRLFWCAYLAHAQVRDNETLIQNATARAFTPQALAACGSALYRCGSAEEAAPYVETLVQTALRLIDRNRPARATAALEAAFAYDASDGYARLVFSRLDAAKEMLGIDAYVSLSRCVIHALEADSPQRLTRTLAVIDCALAAGAWDRADDMIESVLDNYPRESELYLRKLLCENRAKTVRALWDREYPRLGETFGLYVAALPASRRIPVVRDTFEALCASVQKHGFEAYVAALWDVLGFVPQGVREPVFGADAFCRVGEMALAAEDFVSASACFEKAIVCDAQCHTAYWGALKAALSCKDNRALEACDTPLDEVGSLYADACKAAQGRDEKFLAEVEAVSAHRRTLEKREGHVFRAEDFVVRDGTAVRYIGKGSADVYVGGGIFRIGDNAFRGADVRSVFVGDGVTAIGSYAFAFADIERVRLPDGLRTVGVNPFMGCRSLRTLQAGGRMHVADGLLYFDERLVSFCPAARTETDDAVQIEKGTEVVGAKAFWHPAACAEIRLPVSVRTAEACAFCGCEGLTVRGMPQEQTAALTGEGAFGGGKIVREKVSAAGARWNALYGDGRNNMAADGNASGDGRIDCRKIIETDGKVNGGLLLKNDRVLYTVGNSLCIASLPSAKAAEKRTIPLGTAVAGTGVLWEEFLVQPVEKDGGTLFCIDENGKTVFEVRIGQKITRPVCLGGDTLLCVCGDMVFAVDLRRGSVASRKMREKITSVPCAGEGAFAVADEKNIYLLTPDLQCESIHTLSDVNYGAGTGKILRGRIVYYNGAFYWIERNSTQLLLGIYDGQRAVCKSVPRSVADFFQTQPIFRDGKFYAGATHAVVEAVIKPACDEWEFYAKTKTNGKYTDMMLLGGKPFLSAAQGAFADLRIRAAYEGTVLLCDIVRGGIYAARF